MSSGSYAPGRFTDLSAKVGKNDAVISPRVGRPDFPLLVFNHTHNGDGSEAMGAGGTGTATEKIISRLADRGFSIVCPNGGQFGDGGGYGNAVWQSRIADAVTWGHANLPCNGDPPPLVGGSGGSTACLRAKALSPTSFGPVVTWLTVCNLTQTYQKNWNGQRSGIGTAYGVTYPTPLPANADPSGALLLAALAGEDLLCHFSSDDLYAIGDTGHPWPIETFAAATGAEIVNVGALGHSDASIAATDIQQVIDFIEDHLT